jgi:hypothetical protein
MPLAGADLLDFALETIASVSDLTFFRDLGNDVFQFRDVTSGQFAASYNVWAKFREDYTGGGM